MNSKISNPEQASTTKNIKESPEALAKAKKIQDQDQIRSRRRQFELEREKRDLQALLDDPLYDTDLDD